MSALGSLVVNLGLNFAQYTGGLDKSEQATLAAAKRIQDTWDSTKTRLAQTAGAIAGGLAAGFTINAFKGLIGGAIETGAALDDLRMQTGATVEALSGLVQVGKYNNMGPEQIGAAMSKLASNLAGATEESKGTGKALDALGINFDKFKVMRPEEQFQAVAKGMAQFEDGAGKTAVAMALFGKQGAQMIPFLKDLAEVEQLAAKTTTEQAAAAANLDDNLDRITKSTEAWKTELAQGMIPALDLGAQAFLDVMNGSGGLREEVRRLVADGSVDRWTKGAITGLTYAADAATYLWRGIKFLAESLGAYAAAGVAYFGSVGEAIGKALRGDFMGALGSLNDGVGRAKTIIADLGATGIASFSEDTFGSRIRARMADIQGVGAAAEETKKRLPFENIMAKDAKAAKEAKSALDALLDSIDKRIAAGNEELSVGEKLTEGEKLAAEVRRKLATTTDAQILAGKGLVETRLKEMLAVEKSVAANRLELQTLEDIRKERVKMVQTMEQSVDQMLQGNESLREEIELIGATEGQQLRILQRRNEITIATKQATLAELERASAITGTQTREEIALQAEIELLQERNGLLSDKYNATQNTRARDEERQGWQDLYRSVDDFGRNAFMAIAEEGVGGFKRIGQQLKASVLDMLYQMTVKRWLVSIGASVFGGGFSDAAAAASGVSGGGGGVGSALQLGSMAYQAYSGTGMIGTAWGALSGALGFGSTAVGTSAATLAATPWAGSAMAGMASTSAATGAMSAMGAGGVAGLIAMAVINILGGMRSERMIGSGLTGTLGNGTTLDPWEEWREGGTLLSGPEFSSHNPLGVLKSYRERLKKLQDEGQGASQTAMVFETIISEMEKNTQGLDESTRKQSESINKAYDGVRSSVVTMGNYLGLAGDKVKDWATTLAQQDLNFQGLKPEEVEAKIATVLGKAGTTMAQQLLGYFEPVTETITRTLQDNVGSALAGQDAMYVYRQESETTTKLVYRASEFAKAGETALDTLTRLSTSMRAMNEASDMLGFGIHDVSLKAADAADKFIEAAGGLERFSSVTSTYFRNFYGEDKQREYLARAGARQFEAIGIQGVTAEQLLGPGAREALMAGIESLVSNPKLYIDAMEVANGLTGLFNAAETAAPAIENVRTEVDALTQAYQNAVKSLTGERDTLAVEMLRALGKEKEAKALEKAQYMAQFAGLDDVRRLEIETLYDANRATRAFIDGLKEAAQAQRDRLTALRDDLVGRVNTAAAATDKAMAAYERLAAEQRTKLTETITAVRGVFDAASNGAKALFGEVDAASRFQGRQGQDFIAQALETARAGGALPDSKALGEAITGAQAGLAKEVFASQAEQDYARLVLANELRDLQDISGDQLTEAERQLKKLDDQVKFARDQLDELRGIGLGVDSVDAAIRELVAAYNREATTRADANARGIVGTGKAIYDRATGTGLTADGVFFNRDDMAQAARDVLAANPGGSGSNSVYDALAKGGFTLAQYNDMFDLPAGTLEAEAKALGRPIFHKGTNFVPRTGYALLEKGEAVIPAAVNPWRGGAAGLGGDTSVLEALLGRLIGSVDALGGPGSAATQTLLLLQSVKRGNGLIMAAEPAF